MKILGVVTARGGSKRLPGKNIAPLGGKPLIAWSIEVGLATCDTVVTSTDSPEIADVAMAHGSEVVMCPLDLEDPTQHIPQVRHAVKKVLEPHTAKMAMLKNPVPPPWDAVILLQPTSPFRNDKDITGAVEVMQFAEADVVISVVEFDAKNSIFTLGLGGRMRCVTDRLQGQVQTTYQPRFYVENGAVYLLKTEYLLNEGDWYGLRSYAYVMPRDRSVDIDTRADFDAAAAMLEAGGPLSHLTRAPKKLVVAP